MDTSTVIAAFALGAALSAGLAIAFLNRSPPNASSSGFESSKNKKKKNKSKQADHDDGSTQPQPVLTPTTTATATATPTATATTTNNANKSSKKKKVKQVQVNTEVVPAVHVISKSAPTQPKEEIPFPSLNSNNVPKKKGKVDKATSYAFVAQSEAPTKPDPPSTATPTRAYEQPKPKQSKHVEPQKPQIISVPKPAPIPYSDSESEEEEEVTPAARVLKFQEKEQLDDGWVRVTEGASTSKFINLLDCLIKCVTYSIEKAPTLRLVGSSSLAAAHSFPIKPAPTPQNQLTKTQLNNQRKAEKLRQAKEAARIIQEQRKIDFRRDAAAATAKEKAIAETMKRGAAMEKQRLEAVAALAKNNVKSDSGTWEAADSGSSFWD
ncbi:UNVERIFIED_CONTAM: hypothetical protein HDU68_010168 [Siphonaria sp. JEL0065]|nr:hypothetical protein HDU68_010168 [Siphonaria sp. JEL0065]